MSSRSSQSTDPFDCLFGVKALVFIKSTFQAR